MIGGEINSSPKKKKRIKIFEGRKNIFSSNRLMANKIKKDGHFHEGSQGRSPQGKSVQFGQEGRMQGSSHNQFYFETR